MSTRPGSTMDDQRSPRSAEVIGSYFDCLGRAVEQTWAAHRNNEDHFPGVAAGVLTEMPVPNDVDAIGVLEFLTSRHRLVPQEELGFGEPPVTLYRARDFRISALYWLDGSTTVHQHMFSGAFRVLAGSSIHARYHFSPAETVTSRLLVGDLRFGRAELLQCGDVREILAGDAFIHALFHLDRPSVTIVVRTDRQEIGPQFEYLRPGLAFDPFFKDQTLDRQLRGLTTLHEFSPQDALRCAHDMISTSDLLGGFFVARHWLRLDRSDKLDGLIDHLIRRHGKVAEILDPVFAESKRKIGILTRRKLVQDATHRLFLALVLNLPDRSSVDTIVRGLFPDKEPADLLARWVEELSSPELSGISGLRLTDAEVQAVRAALHGDDGRGSSQDGLETLASKIVSTPLLEALLR